MPSTQCMDGFASFFPSAAWEPRPGQPFVQQWLGCCELDTAISFGDLRKLLFENAKQPTLVVVAKPRRARAEIPSPETFEYWAQRLMSVSLLGD